MQESADAVRMSVGHRGGRVSFLRVLGRFLGETPL